MDAKKLNEILAGIPHMTPEQGVEISSFIIENKLRNCLELGFAHGVGTAYIANAVNEIGGGKVVACDLNIARQRVPDIFTTLKKAGIDPASIEIHFGESSYTWRMMKFLEEGRAGTFDFVYIDGAHSWSVDGFAFFLAEKLLRPGGWVLFDDINWTFEEPSMQQFDWVRAMPEEERRTAQVRKIWDLLVRDSRNFDHLVEKDDWAYARKAPTESQQKIIYRYHPMAETLLVLKNNIRKTKQLILRR